MSETLRAVAFVAALGFVAGVIVAALRRSNRTDALVIVVTLVIGAAAAVIFFAWLLPVIGDELHTGK